MRKIPNYIYKVESDFCPTTYFDSVDKVMSLVDDHCIATGRKAAAWRSAGNYRLVMCKDERGCVLESNASSDTVRTHSFIVEQIEIH